MFREPQHDTPLRKTTSPPPISVSTLECILTSVSTLNLAECSIFTVIDPKHIMIKGLSFRFYFSLSHHPFQIWKEVAETIREFYPIGIDRQSPEYEAHPGWKKRGEIINANIIDNKTYIKRWGGFLKILGKDFNTSPDDLQSTTYGVVPGYSADLVLERYEDESLLRIKKLTFAVSLIGPFYSVCGVDETFIKIKHNDYGGGYHAINVITASPHEEFEKDFNHLQRRIETRFKGYKFVPISMCLKMVEGLDHHFLESGTVYDALFNNLFNFYYFPLARYRGDQYYGYGENISGVKVILSPPPPMD